MTLNLTMGLANFISEEKDGNTMPGVHYQKLNAVTHNDAYPVPRAQDCLDALVGPRMFSTMDILLTYNQVPMAEKDIPKMAFTTTIGLFEFTTILFGLMTAPATCKQLIELVFSGLQCTTLLTYLDDVIVFSKDFYEQVDHLNKVMIPTGSAGLKLKASKCVLYHKIVLPVTPPDERENLPNPENVGKILS